MKFLVFLVVLLSISFIGSSFKLLPLKANHQNIQQNLQDACTNKTDLNYLSLQYLAKNNYMSKAITNMNQLLNYTFPISIYSTDEFVYRIYVRDYKPNLSYKNDNKSASFGTNQQILIQGSKVQVNFTFNWDKYQINNQSNYKYGYGSAYSISRQLPYTIQINRQDNQNQLKNEKITQKSSKQEVNQNQNLQIGWTGLQLEDINNVTLSPFDLKQIKCFVGDDDPCIPTDQQLFVIKYILSQAPSNQTLNSSKTNFQQFINYNLKPYLELQICCKSLPTNPAFNYFWNSSTIPYTNITLHIKRGPFSIYMDKNGSKPGIYSTFTTQINQLDQCTSNSPNTTFDTKIFGGGQQIISYNVFKNFIRQGIRNKQLDTILSEQFWTTKNFKFTVSDLVPILSNISSVFPLYKSIVGYCSADSNNLTISKGSTNSTIKLLLNSECYLGNSSIKIIYFNVSIQAQTYPRFRQSSFDVQLKSHKSSIIYDDSYGFKLINKTLADSTIKDSLERLYESKLFGSGWQLFLAQKNPALYASENSLLFYDKN